MTASPRLGVVAIGRNEGSRLVRCLHSLRAGRVPLVYVDSGSTDGSPEAARELGAEVVALDMRQPFTAARARNAGFERLLQIAPGISCVQFVDGDCEVADGWVETATRFLDTHAEVVAVYGRRRERHPERSIYNRLCDLDWPWAPGEARHFGGDVMLRAAALREVGGYDPGLIAGEEPELAIRLRRRGGRVWQLDVPMTLHDADMHRFGQWWRRSVRTGYAYAEGAAMNGAPPERHWMRETASALVWGAAMPLVALIALRPWPALAAAIVALYGLQFLRITLRSPLDRRTAALRAAFLLIGKFAETAGAFRFALTRLRGLRGRLIEYK